ncbi:MAG: hemerythrin domain-containing protein [Chitinophagaceae bacterium]|nr:hemerythrin domain-containing protein [Chitinophagaceae bacterium]
MMEELMNTKVGELAVKNYAFIQLFIQNEIDFYCRHDLTLKEAISEAGANIDVIRNGLMEIEKQPVRSFEVKVESWPLDLLADYIEKTHHRYTEKTTMTLKGMVERYLADQPRNEEPVKLFQPLLIKLTGAMAVHMKKEELTFFPVIRKMAASRGKTDGAPVKPLNNSITMFVHEHDQQRDSLVEIRKIFKSYTLQADDDKALLGIMLLMKDLDRDLAHHLHLENNILFPEALRQQQMSPTVE